jgi:hippurate hydrolase
MFVQKGGEVLRSNPLLRRLSGGVNVIPAIQDNCGKLTEWRHDFHMHPELGFEEKRTSGLVADRLEAMGIEVTRGIGKTGVVGVLKGKESGEQSIGLRADMDALPMQELNDFAHRSTIEGKMHGCGHDGHTTMLLGAAEYLAATRNFAGTVNFIFQPAEEGLGGGRVMVEEGLFERFDCDQIYGVHNWPELEAGTIGIKSGPLMAAAVKIDICIQGHGGHAAMPHQSVDSLFIGANLVTSLQSVVSRSIDPQDAVVVSITKFAAGDSYNVIPETCTLQGTLRFFTPEAGELARKRIREVCDGVATAHGGSIDVQFCENGSFPPTINTAHEAALAAKVAAGIFGEENVLQGDQVTPTMGAEDFSFMLQQRPGCYMFLGNAGGPSSCMVHNPYYDFNDQILPYGASLFARIVEELQPMEGSQQQ